MTDNENGTYFYAYSVKSINFFYEIWNIIIKCIFKYKYQMKIYLLVWSGGSSTTKDSGVTPEISFDTNGILNRKNQLSKMEF